MKKFIKRATTYCGKPAKIKIRIEDVNGYISITGGITPYRCRTEHCGGCIHEEIVKALPKLKPFIHLHLVNVKDGYQTFALENSLFHFANGNIEFAKSCLNCNDEEAMHLYAVVMNGLHRKLNKGYDGDWYSCDADALRVYKKEVEKYHIGERIKKEIEEFYKIVEDLK